MSQPGPQQALRTAQQVQQQMQQQQMQQQMQQPVVRQMQPQQPTIMQPQQPAVMQPQQPTVMQPQQPTVMQQQPAVMHQQQPKAAPAPAPQPAPVVSQPANPAAARAIQDAFAQIRGALDAVAMNGMEKKQLIEVDKALAVLRAQIDANVVDEDVMARVTTFVEALLKRDTAAATREQVALVNSDWSEHKDWLKGCKFLVQLVAKKL